MKKTIFTFSRISIRRLLLFSGLSLCLLFSTALSAQNCTEVDLTSTTGPINDNDVATFMIDGSSIPAGATVSDASIALDITHTWVGDLEATLTSPDGTVISLFDRPGEPEQGTFGCDLDNMDITMSDGAANTADDLEDICAGTPPATVSGDFMPIDPFSSLNGENASGMWTLTISDNAAGDIGTLDGAVLTVCYEGGACELEVDCSNIFDQDLSCRSDLPPVDFDLPIIINSCGDPILSALTIIPGNSGCPGDEVIITRTYFIQDDDGNTEECMQTFTIESTEGPVLMIPPNVVVDCGDNTEPGTGTGPMTGTDTGNNDGGAITDNDPAGTSFTATVAGPPAGATVTGISVDLDITHTWVGDLDATLTSPDGTVISLFDRPGLPSISATLGCSDNDLAVSFSDAAANDATAFDEPACDGTVPAISGAFQPIDPFSGLDGEMAAGDWVLSVTDNAGGDLGGVNTFEIIVDWESAGADGDGTGMATATAECSNFSVDVTHSDVSNVTQCAGGTIVRTWTATDGCGRMTSQDQTILVNAPDAPEITECPGDATVTCEEDVIPTPEAVVVEADCDLGFEVTVSDPVVVGDPGCDGTTYTFTYTVTDDCGRTDECVQTFTLDNAAPTVTIPADATVECAADIEVSTDDMTVVQDCPGELTLSVNGPVIDGPENCPGSTYTFTYRAIDDCGRIVNENRVFTIGENDGPTIIAPIDLTCTCLAGINPNPDYATITTACDNGVDAEVTVSGPQIIGALDCPGTRYIYTYTVTDACGRSASDTQTYTVENDGPELTCPENCEILDCFDGDYVHVIEAWIETVEATSSCGVDLQVNNTFNGNPGLCINNGFTPVTFTATDDCGRTSSCQGMIIITDTDAPEIYEDPQDVLVPCNGNTQQIFNEWLATRGGAEAVDGCWTDNINWSASVGPNALNCANGPQAIVVTFTATDGCGNAASTTGIFNTKIQPNMVNVNGLIMREDNEPVANVEVGAYLGGNIPQMDLSDSAGDYAFPELEFDEDTEIKPEKNDDPLNGVSTFDLVVLQQHILGINELNSPYKRIAADINRSGNISTLDLVLLRKLILHIDEEFTDNTSWRFVDADYVFPNPQNPFASEFPEIYSVAGQEEEVADFVAVKIGDLNLDGATYGFMDDEADDRSGLDDLVFEIQDQELIAGEEYRIDVNAQNFERINGFQFTLNFENEAIEVLDIETGDLVNFNEQNFNLAKRAQGAIPMSWNVDQAKDLDSRDVAFSVIIRAKEAVQLSDVLSISSQYTKAEAYQSNELMNVNLTFNNNGQIVTTTDFKLFQNTPNPFRDATTIGFNLPEAGDVNLEIYDVSGRLLHAETANFAAGYNQFELTRSNLPGGILYYHVNTANDSDSKKMILVQK